MQFHNEKQSNWEDGRHKSSVTAMSAPMQCVKPTIKGNALNIKFCNTTTVPIKRQILSVMPTGGNISNQLLATNVWPHCRHFDWWEPTPTSCTKGSKQQMLFSFKRSDWIIYTAGWVAGRLTILCKSSISTGNQCSVWLERYSIPISMYLTCSLRSSAL